MNSINDLVYESTAKDASLKVHAALIADLQTGLILYASDLARKVFGYDGELMVGVGVDNLVPDAVQDKHSDYRTEYAKHPRSRPMGHGLVLFGKKRDGTLFPVQVSLSSTDIMGIPVVVAYVVDLSEAVKTAVRIKDMVESGTPSEEK